MRGPMVGKQGRGPRGLGLAVCALLLSIGPSTGFPQTPSGVVRPDARFERVFSGGEFTEGPAVSFDGRVFFSDLTWASNDRMEAGHLWCFDPSSGRTSIYRSPSNMSNGIAFDCGGAMVVAEGEAGGARRLSRTDLATGKSNILVVGYEGRRLNSPNDLVINDDGCIFFTDPRYGESGDRELPFCGVFCLAPDGSVRAIVKDLPMPNGIAISPDRKTLYVGCYKEAEEEGSTGDQSAGTAEMFINAYVLNPDGSVRFRERLVTFPPEEGPDGMAVDVRGRLYVAIRNERQPRIDIFLPNGELVDHLALDEVPSNATFGRGADSATLYVTAGGGLYRIQLTTEGFHAECHE